MLLQETHLINFSFFAIACSVPGSPYTPLFELYDSPIFTSTELNFMYNFFKFQECFVFFEPNVFDHLTRTVLLNELYVVGFIDTIPTNDLYDFVMSLLKYPYFSPTELDLLCNFFLFEQYFVVPNVPNVPSTSKVFIIGDAFNIVQDFVLVNGNFFGSFFTDFTNVVQTNYSPFFKLTRSHFFSPSSLNFLYNFFRVETNFPFEKTFSFDPVTIRFTNYDCFFPLSEYSKYSQFNIR